MIVWNEISKLFTPIQENKKKTETEIDQKLNRSVQIDIIKATAEPIAISTANCVRNSKCSLLSTTLSCLCMFVWHTNKRASWSDIRAVEIYIETQKTLTKAERVRSVWMKPKTKTETSYSDYFKLWTNWIHTLTVTTRAIISHWKGLANNVWNYFVLTTTANKRHGCLISHTQCRLHRNPFKRECSFFLLQCLLCVRRNSWLFLTPIELEARKWRDVSNYTLSGLSSDRVLSLLQFSQRFRNTREKHV